MSERVALVTGAASGIGAATAELLAARGWRVAALDRDGGGVEDFAARDPERRLALVADVRREDQVEAAFAACVDAFGRLDGVAAIAGVEVDGRVEDLAVESWEEVVDVGLKGTFLTARAAIPRLRRSGGGALVTTGSVLGRASLPGVTAYAAAKAGIEALTRTIAVDHAGEGIRAVCVIPGTTDTPLTWQSVAAAEVEAAKEAAAREVPLGWIAEPRHIAQVVAFAISDEAAFVTGTSIVVDGGLLARVATEH